MPVRGGASPITEETSVLGKKERVRFQGKGTAR